MAENLQISGNLSKKDTYEELLPQISGLLSSENDVVANMANLSAVLKTAFDFFWVGFYIVKNNELVLGPFQGPIACTRIQYGRGVCGTAWKDEKTLIVPDVDEFPEHIACSSLSKSEIVVPVFHAGQVVAVLDVDSSKWNDFDKTDGEYLEKIVTFLKF